MKKLKQDVLFIMTIAFISISLVLTSCNKSSNDDGDTVKEELKEAGEETKEVMEDANKGVKEGYDETKDVVNDLKDSIK